MRLIAARRLWRRARRGCGDAKPGVDGDPERGRLLLRQFGCGACHRIAGVADAQGNVGPPLDGVAKRVYLGGVVPNSPAQHGALDTRTEGVRPAHRDARTSASARSTRATWSPTCTRSDEDRSRSCCCSRWRAAAAAVVLCRRLRHLGDRPAPAPTYSAARHGHAPLGQAARGDIAVPELDQRGQMRARARALPPALRAVPRRARRRARAVRARHDAGAGEPRLHRARMAAGRDLLGGEGRHQDDRHAGLEVPDGGRRPVGDRRASCASCPGSRRRSTAREKPSAHVAARLPASTDRMRSAERTRSTSTRAPPATRFPASSARTRRWARRSTDIGTRAVHRGRAAEHAGEHGALAAPSAGGESEERDAGPRRQRARRARHRGISLRSQVRGGLIAA